MSEDNHVNLSTIICKDSVTDPETCLSVQTLSLGGGGGGWFWFTQLAFLPSVISSFFTHIKGGGGGAVPPSPCPRSATGIYITNNIWKFS